MNKNKKLIFVLFMFLFSSLILFSSFVIAANNPGHDILYIEQEGDSELNGSLNITRNLRVSNLFYSYYLDILANGTVPNSFSYPGIYTPSTNSLVINAPTSLYLLKDAGSMVYIGGSGVSLNVSGNLYIQGSTATINGQNICLENGTNCPSALGGANISGSGSDNYLVKWISEIEVENSILYEESNKLGIRTIFPTVELDVNGSINISNSSGKIYTPEICLAGSCITSWPEGGGSGSGSVNGSGNVNSIPLWNGTSELNSSIIYQVDGNIGIGINTSLTEKLHVNGNIVLGTNPSINTTAGNLTIDSVGGYVIINIG
jgi:hypothetical protein